MPAPRSAAQSPPGPPGCRGRDSAPLRPSGGRGRGPRRRRGRVRWVSTSALESPTSPWPSPPPRAERESWGSVGVILAPLPWPQKGGDDAVQGAQLLLGAKRALKQIAQIAGHARALVGVAQEPALAQRLLEMLEEA